MEYTLDKKLQGFQLIAQEKLQAILCSIPGKKDLILEHNLIKPLEHICAASWLKLKGIGRIYKFDAENPIPRQTTDQVQIFMIRSDVLIFQRVLRHISEHESRQPSLDIGVALKNFHIICVPSCFSQLQFMLEEEGLYGLVQLHRFNWDFIYCDQGVLSMELPNIFSSVFLQGDTSLLPAIAQSLRTLQMVCGRPDLILTFGEHAANIVKMMDTLGPWSKNDSEEGIRDLSALLVIDRDKDYASTLLTPAIYAGLLLEVFQYRAGEIELEMETNKILRQKLQIFLPPKNDKKDKTEDRASKPAVTSKPPTIRLNSLYDEIYGENRYKHFAQASSLVRAQANAIGLEVHKLSDMKLDEMHDYVARKLPKITELKTKVMRHLNASEKVIEMLASNFRKVQSLEEDILNNVSRKQLLAEIDELLTTDGQKYNTLRLVCLLHLSAGISIEELSQIVRNYCNYFGTQQLHVFHTLANAGLLPIFAAAEEKKSNNAAKQLLSNLPIPKFQQTEFQANANRLRLLVSTAGAEATNAVNNSTAAGACPSYVFNSLYIPLVAQLCSFLLKSNSADDFSSKLSMVDKLQLHIPKSSNYGSGQSVKTFAQSVKQNDEKDIFPLRRRNIFVYIIGGATYAEIGACDLISRLTGAQIIVASDSLVAGADLISGAFS